MSLATKYRPKTFKDVCEQETIINIVSKLCEKDDLDNRNFLFIGPAGCGKTTTARIMANVLNNGTDNSTIEMDAASNNGVDSVREIVNQARMYPVGSKYKVFVIDECFPGNTFVNTPSGYVQIKDLNAGDLVYNLSGVSEIKQVFRNSVKPLNLVYVRVNKKQIITTKDHLFFTNDGWVAAKDLRKGELVYDYQGLSRMRERISILSQRSENNMQQGMQLSSPSEKDFREALQQLSERVSSLRKDFLDSQISERLDLFQKVFYELEKRTSGMEEFSRISCTLLAIVYLSCMQQGDGDTEERSSDSMFFSMCDETSFSEKSRGKIESSSIDECLRMVWQFISSELRESEQEDLQYSMSILSDKPQGSYEDGCGKDAHSYDTAQSRFRSRDSEENESYQGEAWNFTSSRFATWWKRILHQSSDSFETKFARGVGVRVSCNDRCEEKQQSDEICYELQTRPCLTKIKAGSRGGWDRPQYEIATVLGYQGNKMSRGSRVESVEVYQPGNNEQLFSSCFTDSELHSQYVTMYDLEVDGHPSYFVNDILAHNCHTFSPQAWQIFLKPLEDAPAKSIFIFCTTNPEKIPATIISRVQTFQLSKISLKGIFNRLKYIIEEENKEGDGITFTDDAVNFIAKLAGGGMRDSITLLDKTLAFTHDLTSESVSQALGLPNYDDYFKLLGAYSKKDNKTVVQVINDVYNSGVNFVKWFEGFHSFVMNVVKYIFLQDINLTMIPSHYQEKISKYGTAHSIVCLKLANKLLKLNYELKTTQYLQEVASTYLCQIPKKEG